MDAQQEVAAPDETAHGTRSEVEGHPTWAGLNTQSLVEGCGDEERQRRL